MSFAFGFLLDEHIHPALHSYLRLHAPGLAVHMVGDGVGPERGTLDPQILIWCEAHNSILLTDNRRSMPAHLADHVRQGRTVPGIFSIDWSMSVAQLAEHLIFVAQVSLPDEYQNSIWFLPIFLFYLDPPTARTARFRSRHRLIC